MPIDVIAVGDAGVGERGEALVAAAREAMVNAAKFAPDAGEVAVYAELGNGRAQVFVRDRGQGFDPAGVPTDRKGVRESIVGRMERSGGTAKIRSTPETGTEIELEIVLERRRNERRHASSSWTTTACSGPGCAPSWRAWSRWPATRGPSRRRCA